MSIAELGSLGEFVAALAVLVTLIYLAYQTKISVRMHEQSVSSLNSQMSSHNADGWVQVFLQTAMDERLSTIVGKLQHARSLEESEIVSAELFLTAYFLRLENIDYQRINIGFEGIDDLLRKQVGVYSASPDFQRWWSKASQEGFSDWFVDAVSSILEKDK